MIPVFSNTLGIDELKAVSSVFQSHWLGRGEHCREFEAEFARHIRATRSLLFNCCTSATYAALRALGIGAGDEVIIPTINFVGVANAVIDVGAVPVFADVDMRTLNILPHEIKRLTTARTKAVFLLHYGGHPVEMRDVWEVTDGRTLILEDCANAVASFYHAVPCGKLGDAGVWSFDAMKILVMGDGGALWLREEAAHERAKAIRYLGLAPSGSSGVDSAKAGKGRWWETELVTTSGRFISNDIAAAIGREQLRKVHQFIQHRRMVWDRYQKEFKGIEGLTRPPEPLRNCTSSYYLYWIQAEERDKLAAYLKAADIYTTFRYYPLHLIEHYQAGVSLPIAEWVAEHTLCLPLHQNLTDHDVDRIVGAVREFFNA